MRACVLREIESEVMEEMVRHREEEEKGRRERKKEGRDGADTRENRGNILSQFLIVCLDNLLCYFGQWVCINNVLFGL